MWGEPMKRFEISYNPYSNKIHFRVAEPVEEPCEPKWRELPPESSFVEYQNDECIFENCVDQILNLINKYINTTESLEIIFKGTVEDFDVLRKAIFACSDPRAKKITCTHAKTVMSSDIVLERLKRAYSNVENEFAFVLNAETDDRGEIVSAVRAYKDTVKQEIAICLIGPDDVGKTALVNAFIGREILVNHSKYTTVVRNYNGYRVEFDYLNNRYEIDISGNNFSVNKPEEADEHIISSLFTGCDSCANEQEVINTVLSRFNDICSKEDSGIENSMSIYVPFVDSRLNYADYSFCFIDTPGIITEDDEQGTKLSDLILNQTNVLPIIVLTKQALTSNDLFDLRDLFDEMKSGYSKQNSILAISMSDQLSVSQICEEVPDIVREEIADPTIMYISPITALGVKKGDTVTWIDAAYKDVFETTSRALLRTMPPNHNIIPCGRKISASEKHGLNDLLYASGIPSLENEINYFAERFAEYKKCTQGQRFLFEAVNKTHKSLDSLKKQLEQNHKNDRLSRQKEEQQLCYELLDRIRKINKPNADSVISRLTTQFEPVLSSYCESVPEKVRELWDSKRFRPYTNENLVKDMQQHCQENLYHRNDNSIKAVMQGEFLDLASGYFSSIKSYVHDKYENLSSDVRKDLDDLFEGPMKEPYLNDVGINPFKEVGMTVLRTMGGDEKLISYYSNGFIANLKGDNKRIGSFNTQCIREPAQEYSKQINCWAEQLIKEIENILKHDNVIISDLDNEIAGLENRINDLDKRLNNLSNTCIALMEMIPKDDY